MPSQAPPSPPRKIQVKVGTDGIMVSSPDAAAADPAIPALQAQVGLLQQRVERLKEERSNLVSEADDASNRETQAAVRERLQTVQGQLADAEQGLKSAEDRLAALGVGPAPAYIAETAPPPALPSQPDIPRNVMKISILSVLFIGMPLAVGIARWLFLRASPAPVAPSLSGADAQRLVRLEQSMDAIAIELERISEGQRFVTKLLSDPRLGAGTAAEPVRVPQPDAVERR